MAAEGGESGSRPPASNAAEPLGAARGGVLGWHPRPRACQRYGCWERLVFCRVLSAFTHLAELQPEEDTR